MDLYVLHVSLYKFNPLTYRWQYQAKTYINGPQKEENEEENSKENHEGYLNIKVKSNAFKAI